MSTSPELRAQKLALSTVHRNPDWPKLQRAYLRRFTRCACCGTPKPKILAHHKLPVQFYPELEMEESNLIALCYRGNNCHLLIGHLMDYWSYNKNVEQLAEQISNEIKNRPRRRRK